MKCSNPGCNRGVGLVAYQRDWLSKRRYCSKHCRDAFVVDAPNLLKRFVVALAAFVGLIEPVSSQWRFWRRRCKSGRAILAGLRP